ncbi:MAG: hypothetical protein LBF85_07845 [Tannerella sp.]|nr:hypothetical protein [Tannerella sp.]
MVLVRELLTGRRFNCRIMWWQMTPSESNMHNPEQALRSSGITTPTLTVNPARG